MVVSVKIANFVTRIVKIITVMNVDTLWRLSLMPITVYMVSLVFGILVLNTSLWKVEKCKPNQVIKTVTFVMHLFLADTVLWLVYCLVRKDGENVNAFFQTVSAFDIFIFCSAFLVGEALLSKNHFGFGDVVRFLWPFMLLLPLIAFVHSVWLYVIEFLMGISYCIIMLIRQWKMLSLRSKYLSDNYSETFSRDLFWYKRITIFFVALVTLYILPILLSAVVIIPHQCYIAMWMVYDILGASMWVFMVHNMLRLNYEQSLERARHDMNVNIALYDSDDSDEASLLKEENANTLVQKNDDNAVDVPHALWIDNLENAVLKDKIYLQPDITSSELAKYIGTNRTYLSEYLNNTLHTTFYDYINGFRMSAVDELLKDKSLGMTDIAERSGFSDIRTFRRLFQEKYGCLPSKYER